MFSLLKNKKGFNPKSIKVEYVGRKVHITGKEEYRGGAEDYSVKDFKKCYDVPQTVEIEKLVCFMTYTGFLVIEFPCEFYFSVYLSFINENSKLLFSFLK